MMNLSQLYNSLHLHLGIKRIIASFFLKINLFIDQHILFKVLQPFDRLLFKRIVYHYGADYRWNDQKSQNIKIKKYSYGYGLLHYSFIRNQRSKRILCIGSMYGFIPYLMSRACMENGFGHVDFVDAGYDIHDPRDEGKHIYGQGFWKKPEAQKHFDYLLNQKYITTYVMTTKEYAKKYSKRRYDYIYLDGDHRYVGAKYDFQTFWPKLNEGGYMTLHDIHFEAVAGGITFEQWKLWEELVHDYRYKLEFYNHYSGLGIIQKNTKRPIRFNKIFKI